MTILRAKSYGLRKKEGERRKKKEKGRKEVRKKRKKKEIGEKKRGKEKGQRGQPPTENNINYYLQMFNICQ